MKRILFLSPRLPVPADTGAKIRTSNILKQLVKHFQVDVISFSFETNDHLHKKSLENIGIHVELVKMHEPSFWKKVLGVLFHVQPFSCLKYFHPDMVVAVEKALREKKYDLVHIDHIHMAHYLKFAKQLPCYVDEHNVEYKILERCANVEKQPFKKALYRQQSTKMKKFEARYLKQCQGAFAVSEDDAVILRAITENAVNTSVMANGVDTRFFVPNADAVEEDSLVFTGSMDWLPNDDAMIYFCKEIMPLINQKKPQVKLFIVGRNPTAELQAVVNKNAKVEITGRVPDVRAYVYQSKIFIVPIRIGGGTRLKILEAMSMEKAVVSTSVGAEGINYCNGGDILIEDDPARMAEQIIHLMEDDDRRKTLGQAARQCVLKEYDWDIIGERMRKIYESP
ncbi:MAG: glycosyltransferase [Candidatus Omnitrophica bacterium]|nr:glycosyltransferase [Candidatus Omnitrophota bacterium]